MREEGKRTKRGVGKHGHIPGHRANRAREWGHGNKSSIVLAQHAITRGSIKAVQTLALHKVKRETRTGLHSMVILERWGIEGGERAGIQSH